MARFRASLTSGRPGARGELGRSQLGESLRTWMVLSPARSRLTGGFTRLFWLRWRRGWQSCCEQAQVDLQSVCNAEQDVEAWVPEAPFDQPEHGPAHLRCLTRILEGQPELLAALTDAVTKLGGGLRNGRNTARHRPIQIAIL